MNVFFPSTTGGLGTGFCGGPLGSDCLGIMGSLNLLGPVQTAGGQATLVYTIPPSFGDRALYVQAVIIAPSRAFLSNPVEIEMTSGAPAVCGDGVVDSSELCDDGTNLGLELGDCVPGCSGRVEHVVEMVLSEPFVGLTSDFALGATRFGLEADANCPLGYKAMITDGSSRIASVSPLTGDGQVDWVLAPYTAYYAGVSGDHVWTTDDVALLGVRDGSLVDLGPARAGFSSLPSDRAFWTGLASDWTAGDTCQGWTSSSARDQGSIGNTGNSDDGFWNIIPNDCGTRTRQLMCIEQVEICGIGTQDVDCDDVLADVDCDDQDDTVGLDWVGHCDMCDDVFGSNHVASNSYTPLMSPIPGTMLELTGGEACLMQPMDFFSFIGPPNNAIDVQLEWRDTTATLELAVVELIPPPGLGLPVWTVVRQGTCVPGSCELTYTPGRRDYAVRVKLTTPSAVDSGLDGSFDATSYTISYGFP
jgi:hypothetical protein